MKFHTRNNLKCYATDDKPSASNEVKPEAEADVSKVIEANSRVSSTALQSVSDMNSAAVGSAGAVVVDAAEVSSVTVTFNATVVKDNDEFRSSAVVAQSSVEAKCKGIQLADVLNVDWVSPTPLLKATTASGGASEVAVEAKVNSDAVPAEDNFATAGDNFNAAENAAAGTKATATEAAAAETKCKGIQLADVMNVEGESPTALQPASDMSSLKGGVEAVVTVTANATADVLNVDGVSPTPLCSL